MNLKYLSCFLVLLAITAGMLLFPGSTKEGGSLKMKNPDCEMTLHAYQYRISLI